MVRHGGCQALASDIHVGREHYQHLDVPQLLKHALGLATGLGQRFSLVYVYYNWPCSAAADHEQEIARFADRAGPEVRFASVTYQKLFARLAVDKDCPRDYLSYLGERYFPNPKA